MLNQAQNKHTLAAAKDKSQTEEDPEIKIVSEIFAPKAKVHEQSSVERKASIFLTPKQDPDSETGSRKNIPVTAENVSAEVRVLLKSGKQNLHSVGSNVTSTSVTIASDSSTRGSPGSNSWHSVNRKATG